jgi:hypothetical protein
MLTVESLLTIFELFNKQNKNKPHKYEDIMINMYRYRTCYLHMHKTELQTVRTVRLFADTA